MSEPQSGTEDRIEGAVLSNGKNGDAPTIGRPPAAVLVVDDNAASRLAVRAMLAPLEHVVVEADSGSAALRAVDRQAFAVVLMDVRMPTMDGYETARLIRQRTTGLTPIIFVTAGVTDDTEMATAYASGAVDFISMPMRADVLRAKVSAFVELLAKSQELHRSVEAITALNAALRDSEVRARAVLQNVADGIVTAAADGLIESFNESARRLFGYRDEEVIGRPLQLLIAPSHHDDFSDPAGERWSLLTARNIPATSTETVGCRKDGSCFPMELDLSRMQIGERTFTIGCIRDISGRKAYTEALELRTLHDDVTGLPNRALFGDRMDQAIATAERSGEPRGVLFVDLDDFREVNEVPEREHADAVLQAVAARLQDTMGASDTVARLGGSQFGILPSGAIGVPTAAGIAWKVREAFEHPFVIGDDSVNLDASIGLAFFPQHGRTTADLWRRADAALHKAKLSGSRLPAVPADADQQTEHRLRLLGELRDGIPRGELRLHFQPKVDLVTRRTTGVEALVRWQHPSKGLLMPAEFLPEAMRTELVEPLTRWVLDEALQQQRRWNDVGFDLTMAVNVNPRSLRRDSQLPDTIAELTSSWTIAPGTFFMEITETALADADAPMVLGILHSMGVCVAIDDFGTGHSSLVYLQRLPVDQVKVDQSFVLNIASVPGDAVIVRSTIDLAHNLGLTVVAEGVEDEAALDMLVEYGCDQAQGYYISRPKAADELTAWLAESPFGATPLASAAR